MHEQRSYLLKQIYCAKAQILSVFLSKHAYMPDKSQFIHV